MTAEGNDPGNKGSTSQSGEEPKNRIEGVAGGIGPAPADSDQTRSARDWLDSFFSMPADERFLAGCTLTALLAFAFAKGWQLLFRFGEMGGWFVTFALIGAVATGILLVTKRFGLTFLSPLARGRALLAAALLPGCGLLIELLGEIWFALLLASAIGMVRAALRINRRDDILKW